MPDSPKTMVAMLFFRLLSLVWLLMWCVVKRRRLDQLAPALMPHNRAGTVDKGWGGSSGWFHFALLCAVSSAVALCISKISGNVLHGFVPVGPQPDISTNTSTHASNVSQNAQLRARRAGRPAARPGCALRRRLTAAWGGGSCSRSAGRCWWARKGTGRRGAFRALEGDVLSLVVDPFAVKGRSCAPPGCSNSRRSASRWLRCSYSLGLAVEELRIARRASQVAVGLAQLRFGRMRRVARMAQARR